MVAVLELHIAKVNIMFLENYQNSKQVCKMRRPICKQEESGFALTVLEACAVL